MTTTIVDFIVVRIFVCVVTNMHPAARGDSCLYIAIYRVAGPLSCIFLMNVVLPSWQLMLWRVVCPLYTIFRVIHYLLVEQQQLQQKPASWIRHRWTPTYENPRNVESAIVAVLCYGHRLTEGILKHRRAHLCIYGVCWIYMPSWLISRDDRKAAYPFIVVKLLLCADI